MSGNEVAIQQALMRADAAAKKTQELETRVAVVESIVRAVAGAPAQSPAGAAAAAPAAPGAAPAAPVGQPLPLVPPAAPAPNLQALIAPWASLLGVVAQSAAADVMPAVRTLVQAGQAPGGLATLLGALLQPAVPEGPAAPLSAQRHVPGGGPPRVAHPSQLPPQHPLYQGPPAAPAAPAPGPGAVVSESELDWLRAEGGAAEAGPVVAAQQTSALPPNYQHPPGVAPSPAPGVPLVPMPQ